MQSKLPVFNFNESRELNKLSFSDELTTGTGRERSFKISREALPLHVHHLKRLSTKVCKVAVSSDSRIKDDSAIFYMNMNTFHSATALPY
jgi:hypothetical protein